MIIIHHQLAALIVMMTALGLGCATTWADVTDVNSNQVQSLLESEAVVIDIRREEEWIATGIIETSHTVTFFDKYGSFNARRWLQQVSPLLERDKPVVLICHAGVRSKWVAAWLTENTDFEPVFHAVQGIQGWLDQGNVTIAY